MRSMYDGVTIAGFSSQCEIYPASSGILTDFEILESGLDLLVQVTNTSLNRDISIDLKNR
jgi:hypothetical protein